MIKTFDDIVTGTGTATGPGNSRCMWDDGVYKGVHSVPRHVLSIVGGTSDEANRRPVTATGSEVVAGKTADYAIRLASSAGAGWPRHDQLKYGWYA